MLKKLLVGLLCLAIILTTGCGKAKSYKLPEDFELEEFDFNVENYEPYKVKEADNFVTVTITKGNSSISFNNVFAVKDSTYCSKGSKRLAELSRMELYSEDSVISLNSGYDWCVASIQPENADITDITDNVVSGSMERIFNTINAEIPDGFLEVIADSTSPVIEDSGFRIEGMTENFIVYKYPLTSTLFANLLAFKKNTSVDNVTQFPELDTYFPYCVYVGELPSKDKLVITIGSKGLVENICQQIILALPIDLDLYWEIMSNSLDILQGISKTAFTLDLRGMSIDDAKGISVEELEPFETSYDPYYVSDDLYTDLKE